MKRKITYIMFHIEKALGFEWAILHSNQDKFEFSVISINVSKNSVFERFCSEKNIEFHRVEYTSKWSIPKASYETYKILKKIQPDVVHCHIFEANLIGLPAAILAGVKNRIYTRHHSTFHHTTAPGGKKYDLLINKMATNIISISENVSNVLKLEGVPEAKIHLIHHGFDLSFFNEISSQRIETVKQKYNPEDKHPVIGVISRYTEWKGIKYTLKAFDKILQKYPNAHLILANAKGNDKEVRDLVKKLPENSYIEIQFEEDNAALYKLFDVFIHVPVDPEIEAFGQIYIEALAVGIPSVFTLSGVSREFIVNNENALVVDFRNEHEIYNAACSILENSDLRAKLISNGKKSIEKDFSLPLFIEKLERIYSL
ncbi:MAG TPA: glycosyltransferase family 4 protein [Chitinophagales bacterium]|nr:glycosyltransferase family 4 protein [Chitinophagales bacterium]